jgi:hypothetical protein
MPSDGEILLDCRPISEHAALLEVLKPKYAAAAPAAVAMAPRRGAPSVYQSIGEVSEGQTVPLQRVDNGARGRLDQPTTRRQFSDGERLPSRQSSVGTLKFYFYMQPI